VVQDTALNNSEKKALFRFVSIYTLSSIILIAIIAYLYYNKEIQRQKSMCKIDLQNCIVKVESTLLKAKLYEKEYHFNPKEYRSGVGLFDAKKNPLYSSLTYSNVDFTHIMSKKPAYIHLIKKLEKPLLGVYYIVTEDTTMPTGRAQLLTLIMIVIFFAFIFITFIGYLLSKLLLKPVKEKIHQLDKFIKDSAHEINTPIASLLMSVSALKKKGTLDKKILNHIFISSKQISDVYNSLSHLAFDDIGVEKTYTEMNFKAIVEKSVEFYTEIAKAKQVHIVSDLQDLTIMIDEDDAKKLINNLLSNAVKYNKVGKNITIKLKDNILQVTDEGIGMDQRQKKSVLKRYHRATELLGGFGIGLDIVNSICQRYHIILSIDSKKHHGSTFSLDFSAIVVKT
jgi:two-component system OmpR family sensor kinase